MQGLRLCSFCTAHWHEHLVWRTTGVLLSFKMSLVQPFLAACILLSAGLAVGELALPDGLVSLTSLLGQQMLLEARFRADYFLLEEHSVSQINGAFCGPASSTMLLNALGIPRPLQDGSEHPWLNKTQYNYFDQSNIFNDATEAVTPKANVLREGLSLEDLAKFIDAHDGAGASAHHSAPSTADTLNKEGLDDFRSKALSAISQPDMFAIVNFDRAVLKEVGGGHHSPLAAYHEASDSLLVLDVSRYKYTAWWVSVSSLYQSTSTSVDSGTSQTRGLVIVWSRARYGSAPTLLTPSQLPAGIDNGQPWVPLGGMHAGGSASGQGGMSGYSVSWIAVGCLLVGGALGMAAMHAYVHARARRDRLAAVEEGGSGGTTRLLNRSSNSGRSSSGLGSHPGLWPPIGKLSPNTGYVNPQPAGGYGFPSGLGSDRQKLKSSDVDEGDVESGAPGRE